MRYPIATLALALAAAHALPAHAAPAPVTQALAADGLWHAFTVDSLSATSGGLEWIAADDSLDPSFGHALLFSFDIAAGATGVLQVQDLGFAGDRYAVTRDGVLLGNTSAVAPQLAGSAPFAFDADAAASQAAFSRASFTLGAGHYVIGGSLVQSVLDADLTPLNATAGALRLTVSPVPEPETYALLLAGLGVFGMLARRRGVL
jgi:hypothetical protein